MNRRKIGHRSRNTTGLKAVEKLKLYFQFPQSLVLMKIMINEKWLPKDMRVHPFCLLCIQMIVSIVFVVKFSDDTAILTLHTSNSIITS